MVYAIVKNGVVINTVVSNYPIDDTWIPTDGVSVQIGDTYDGESFFRDDEKILTEEEKLRRELADMRAALELLGVTLDE